VTPSQQTDDADVWGSSLAGRLRLIQAGLVEEPDESRQAFLTDELERWLTPVPPSRKEAFLAALERHFPAWLPSVPEVSSAPEPDLEAVLQRLGKFAESWSEEERGEIANRLGLMGVLPEHAKPPLPARYDELWRHFGRAEKSAPHSERSLRLLGLLAEVFLALDQLSWTLWRGIAPKSAYKKEFDFSKLAVPYLAGDTEVSTDQIRQAIERTRKLIAALLGASGRAASDFAMGHNRTFSPEALEAAARQAKRALEGLDAASWREYKMRFDAAGTTPHLEAAIHSAVAQSAEDLIGGRTR
jgi:hypothetical protein